MGSDEICLFGLGRIALVTAAREGRDAAAEGGGDLAPEALAAEGPSAVGGGAQRGDEVVIESGRGRTGSEQT